MKLECKSQRLEIAHPCSRPYFQHAGLTADGGDMRVDELRHERGDHASTVVQVQGPLPAFEARGEAASERVADAGW
jgi:hypothetical protein